jgi:hypothetical protein
MGGMRRERVLGRMGGEVGPARNEKRKGGGREGSGGGLEGMKRERVVGEGERGDGDGINEKGRVVGRGNGGWEE